MWILTNGLDIGFPKIIGDAIREYNLELENSRQVHPILSIEEKRRRRPIVIGIVKKEALPYGVYFEVRIVEMKLNSFFP